LLSFSVKASLDKQIHVVLVDWVHVIGGLEEGGRLRNFVLSHLLDKCPVFTNFVSCVLFLLWLTLDPGIKLRIELNKRHSDLTSGISAAAEAKVFNNNVCWIGCIVNFLIISFITVAEILTWFIIFSKFQCL